ncbi:hypothetical protein [Psychromonas aquatilis]|uniref:Uncharacterized protein n=1 Tax=Psychromonas aquatilis TaxID=2005072 RepID=A0ABU9GL86_9GAMM
MNKVIVCLLLLFSINVSAVEEAVECRDAKEIATKIGNFNEADIDNTTSLRVCDSLLLPEDSLLISNLRHLATEEDVLERSDMIERMGGDPVKISSYMDERSILLQWLIDFSQFAAPLGLLFILLITVAVNKHPALLPQSLISILKVVFFLLFFISIHKVYTVAMIQYIGQERALMFNQADHKSLDEVRNTDLSKLAPAVNRNSTDLASYIHYIEFVNKATELQRKKLSGVDMELEVPWGLDISNPTFQEFLDYQSVCSSTDYVEIDRELNAHLLNFNYTHLANEAIFYSGSDNTSLYSCNEKYYGKPVELGRVINNTPTLIKRFFMNNFSENMANDLTFFEEVKASMDKLSGTLSLEMEEAERVAGLSREDIYTLLELAENAQREAREQNISVYDTNSYMVLEKSHYENMGSLFDYKKIEGLNTVSNIAYQAIKLNHYNFSDLFGTSLNKDPILSDKKDIGYHFAQPYIQQTSAYQAELHCMINDGENYEIRQQFALDYNNTPRDSKSKYAPHFGGENEPYCFRFNEDGTITAGGDPSNKKEFTLMIKDRVLAFDLYQTARIRAGINHILENDELDNQLILDAINKITPDMYGALNSYSNLSQIKQQLIGSLSTLGDAYDFIYSLTFDTSIPQTYYNYLRMGEENKQDNVNTSKALPRYDLTEYLSHSFLELNNNQIKEIENEENSLAKMARLTCPVIDENGKCIASLYELLSTSNEMMLTQAKSLAAIHFGSSFASGACSAFDKSVDSTVGAVVGKAKLFTPVGAGCVIAQVGNAVSEVVIKPVMLVSATAYVATLLASFLPIFVDMIFLLIGPLCFIVPFVIAFAQLCIDMITGAFKYFAFSKREERDFLEMLSLERSTRTVKSAVVIALISLVVLVIITEILRSPQIGGSIYDVFFKNYDNSFVQSIIRSLAVIFCIVWLTIKIIFSLPIKLINQSLELTDTKGQSLTDNASNFAEGIFTGYVLGKFARTAKSASNNLDKGINQLGNKSGSLMNKDISKTKEEISKKFDNYKNQENTYKTETETETDNTSESESDLGKEIETNLKTETKDDVKD